MLTACSVTSHVAIDAKVNTSHPENKITDVWQHGTYLHGATTDSATNITDLEPPYITCLPKWTLPTLRLT